MNALELSKESGIFWPYYKLIQRLDQNFQRELVSTINTIEGFLTHYQILLLFLFWNDKCGKLVEIGAYKGKTTINALLALQLNQFDFHSVDIFTGSEEHQETLRGQTTYDDFIQNINKFNLYQHVTVHVGTSESVAQKFDDDSIDVVFIDGAHDYDSVKLDILSWFPKLKSGGFMIGHDYPYPNDPNGGFEGLRDAVNENVKHNSRFINFGHLYAIWGAKKQ